MSTPSVAAALSTAPCCGSVCPGQRLSSAVPLWVIGGTLETARAALSGGLGVNLAGGTHHAFAEHGEGYCIFHDMVISLRRLRREGAAFSDY